MLWELPHLAGRSLQARGSGELCCISGGYNLETEPGKWLELPFGVHFSQNCGFVGFQPHSIIQHLQGGKKLKPNFYGSGELIRKFITESLLKLSQLLGKPYLMLSLEENCVVLISAWHQNQNLTSSTLWRFPGTSGSSCSIPMCNSSRTRAGWKGEVGTT